MLGMATFWTTAAMTYFIKQVHQVGSEALLRHLGLGAACRC